MEDENKELTIQDKRTLELLEKSSSIPWLWIVVLGFGLYLIGACIPLVILMEANRWVYPTDEACTNAFRIYGTIGDMFGASNALFGGIALVFVVLGIRQQGADLLAQRSDFLLQLKEVKQSTAAQQKIAKNQQAALAAQVVLPLVSEIRSSAVGDAISTCAQFRRDHGPNKFVEHFRGLQKACRWGTATEQNRRDFDAINTARRVAVGPVQKMYRLSEAGVVTQDRIARIVLTPDHVAFLIDSVRPLEMVIRPRPGGEDHHPPIDYARTLYSDEDIEANRY
ncbi:MAG: hypothetical protein PVI86_07850 [Phycisphaerae bacterium]|jgi:hypothetical protein